MSELIRAVHKGRGAAAAPSTNAQATHSAIQDIVARKKRELDLIVAERRNFQPEPLVLVNVVCTVELSVLPYPPEPNASPDRKISIDFSDLIGPPGTTNPPDTPFIFRLFGPTCTIIAYPTGKLVVTGCSNTAETALAVWYFIAYMQTKGYRVRALGIQPQNLVFTSDVRYTIDLDKLYGYTQATSIHQMDSFPGVRYKMGKSSNGRNNIVVTVFSSGKYIMAGCANHTDAYAYGRVLSDILDMCRAEVPSGPSQSVSARIADVRRAAARQCAERGAALAAVTAQGQEEEGLGERKNDEEEEDDVDAWFDAMVCEEEEEVGCGGDGDWLDDICDIQDECVQ